MIVRDEVKQAMDTLIAEGISFDDVIKESFAVPKLKTYSSDNSYLEEVLLHALSFRPELQSEKINVLAKSMTFPFEAFPTIPSLIFGNRAYNIHYSKKNADKLVDHFSFDALVGIKTHELTHFNDYKDKNSFQLAAWVVKYWFSMDQIFPVFIEPPQQFYREVEFKTDLLACASGATKNLQAYSVQYDEASFIKDRLKRNRMNNYLRPVEHDWIMAQRR